MNKIIAGLSLSLLACSPAPPTGSCTPACGDGSHCDPVSLTCVGDGSDGGATPDLSMTGPCTPRCGGLTPYCNAKAHCVGCSGDAQCPFGQVCKVSGDSAAVCTPGCADDARCGIGKKCCESSCIDPSGDSQNCGACGKVCTGQHASVSCVAGQCALNGKCNPGWGDCDMNPANGCEANLHVDPNNCTACGMKCAIPNAVQACADGCYEASCSFGFDDCNMDPKDGCETSVLSDAANCGACGKSCKNLPNATAACVNAGCLLGSCSPGFADCNGDPSDGCEAQVAYDPKNCGSCGSVCPMNLPSCNMGACSLGADFGPMHTFVGMTTDHYITQGSCSIAMGNMDADAKYFCLHFYGPNCAPKPGYHQAQTPNLTWPKMHKNGGCTQQGSDIPGKTCDAGPCKIGNWSETTTGLVGLICHCS